MKTLKEWFDNLSEDAQSLLKNNCDWIDTDKPDYYRDDTMIDTDEMIYRINRINKYSNSDQADLFMFSYLDMYKRHHTEEETSKLLNTVIKRFVEQDDDYIYCDLPKNFYQLFDSLEAKRKMFILIHSSRSRRLSLFDQLYLVDDFDKIPQYIDIENTLFPDALDDRLSEIFTKDLIKSLCKANENKILVNFGKPNDLFDELFFCENGWNDTQKRCVLKSLYVSNFTHCQTSDTDLTKFEDFMERIVCVDKRYLRFIYDIVVKIPALGNKIYEQKKDSSDLTGDEKGDQLYKYNKTVRKLAKLANICSRKSLSKVNGRAYKELSPLIKIYGYDFSTLYDVIMDEDDQLHNN